MKGLAHKRDINQPDLLKKLLISRALQIGREISFTRTNEDANPISLIRTIIWIFTVTKEIL